MSSHSAGVFTRHGAVQVLGSLACLTDTPEWGGQRRRQPRRLPEDDVILELDVATFTDNVRAPERMGTRSKLQL